nr:hypothetical protein [Nostoc sp. EkiNYC01]
MGKSQYTNSILDFGFEILSKVWVLAFGDRPTANLYNIVSAKLPEPTP